MQSPIKLCQDGGCGVNEDIGTLAASTESGYKENGTNTEGEVGWWEQV